MSLMSKKALCFRPGALNGTNCQVTKYLIFFVMTVVISESPLMTTHSIYSVLIIRRYVEIPCKSGL